MKSFVKFFLVLEHFHNKPMEEVTVTEGDSYTMSCDTPKGDPKPSIIWVYRNTKQSFVIETINREHITGKLKATVESYCSELL